MVTVANAGTYVNTLPVGALQTNLGSNTVAASATLIVSAPKSLAIILTKSFSPAKIKPGGVSTLTITATNPNNTVASQTAPFIDYLPSGMVIASSASMTCDGVVLAPQGGTTITVTGGSLAANSTATLTVMVTAANPGTYVNTLPVGALQTNLGGNTAATSATLTVSGSVTVAPVLTKSFSPSSITSGGVSLLTINLTNSNATAASITGSLTDNFPSGVLIASTPSASTTCGGTLTATKGSNTVVLKGGSIPANGSCTVTVNVTANYTGSCINKLPVGALQTSNGSNTIATVATLTVKAK
jgi:hypothetical protein